MSLGIAFRQIVEAMPEDKQKEYKDKIMTNVVKQFSETVKKQEHDVLNGIGDLIDRLYQQVNDTEDDAINEAPNNLLLEAATTIDILAERIIDSENTSGLRVYSLEQQLLTKQSYIEYLQSRCDDFDVGYVPEYSKTTESIEQRIVEKIAASLKSEAGEHQAKYGDLIESYEAIDTNKILEIYQDVVTQRDSKMLYKTSGQFTAGYYDECWLIENVEIDLGKNESRTYFFTMCWDSLRKEPDYLQLKIYAKPN